MKPEDYKSDRCKEMEKKIYPARDAPSRVSTLTFYVMSQLIFQDLFLLFRLY